MNASHRMKTSQSISLLIGLLLALLSLAGVPRVFAAAPAGTNPQLPSQAGPGDGPDSFPATDPGSASVNVSIPADTTEGEDLPKIFLPLLARDSLVLPPEKVLYCGNLSDPLPIPDNTPAGLFSSLMITDPRLIQDLDVQVNIAHTWVGDLSLRLHHQESGLSVAIMDRPGFPAAEEGCNGDGVRAILDDEITAPVEGQCAVPPAWSPGWTPPAISGIYTPDERLSLFDGLNVSGTWTLEAADLGHNDAGSLREWCLAVTLDNSLPPPPLAPEPPALPPSAQVFGVTGKNQALPLDCESRVAVDYAAFFGVQINEFAFFNRLPLSDNPEVGFVGDVFGTWGQIPPNPYGVHAGPVAALLREYGIQAFAHRPLSWDDLRLEIVAGRPVYVWIVGSVYNGVPVYYRASDGGLSIVAARQHVAMVTGYTEDSVTIQDGASTYKRSLSQFLSSWSAMGNMAITTQP